MNSLTCGVICLSRLDNYANLIKKIVPLDYFYVGFYYRINYPTIATKLILYSLEGKSFIITMDEFIFNPLISNEIIYREILLTHYDVLVSDLTLVTIYDSEPFTLPLWLKKILEKYKYVNSIFNIFDKELDISFNSVSYYHRNLYNIDVINDYNVEYLKNNMDNILNTMKHLILKVPLFTPSNISLVRNLRINEWEHWKKALFSGIVDGYINCILFNSLWFALCFVLDIQPKILVQYGKKKLTKIFQGNIHDAIDSLYEEFLSDVLDLNKLVLCLENIDNLFNIHQTYNIEQRNNIIHFKCYCETHEEIIMDTFGKFDNNTIDITLLCENFNLDIEEGTYNILMINKEKEINKSIIFENNKEYMLSYNNPNLDILSNEELYELLKYLTSYNLKDIKVLRLQRLITSKLALNEHKEHKEHGGNK